MSDEFSSEGIVYVLTNPAMPGIVKIGKTIQGRIDARLRELYSTGVPVPFECAFAGRISDEAKIEKAFHIAFGPYRINPKREFFQIEPEQAIALLELMVIENLTPTIQQEADAVDVESKEASKKLKDRRPVFNFLEMSIPIGSSLNFTQSNDITVDVATERKVIFKDEILSLTAVTRELLGNSYDVSPGAYWLFEGRLLRDIYNATYEMQ